MNKFAFLNHYLNTDLLHERFSLPFFRHLSHQTLKNLIAFLPPYQYMNIGPVYSTSGARAEGIGIACPLLPEHFVTLDAKRVLQKIVAAGKIGERFGATILGLGGFTSVFGDEGEEVSRFLRIAVTSGNTYTAALAVQGLIAAANLVGHRLEECTLAIVGATGDIGSACTRLLAPQVSRVLLSARDERRLEDFTATLQACSSTTVQVVRYTTEAVREADLILTATSALTTIIEPEDLRPGAVVCDVSYPANITRDVAKRRKDVLVFEGGLATWPYYNSLLQKDKLQRFGPAGTVHGCLAETMVLALEGRFENFSIGRGYIIESRVREITMLAEKHGFRPAPLHCGATFYTNEDIQRIKAVVASYRRRTATAT
ncbi:MAG: putative dehydrogenase [Rhodocyclaceae bacterium]|nr:MAG: putative dehydrogenase [Rhodocyclaceae bacterium]